MAGWARGQKPGLAQDQGLCVVKWKGPGPGAGAREMWGLASVSKGARAARARGNVPVGKGGDATDSLS